MSKTALSKKQREVLEEIAKSDYCMVKTIRKRFKCSRDTLEHVLCKLVAKGYVLRSRGGCVWLTVHGMYALIGDDKCRR